MSTNINYHTNREVVIKIEHNRAPDPVRQELSVAVDEALDRALRSNDPPRRVISDMLMGVSEEAATVAIKRKALSRKIQRKRARRDEIAGEPELDVRGNTPVPDKFRTVRLGNQEVNFLLYDNLEENDEENDEELSDRMIIFGTERMINLLAECQDWMLDGTFKVTPALFYQLYTIHGVCGDWVFPCVYSLLPNKESRTYIPKVVSSFEVTISKPQPCNMYHRFRISDKASYRRRVSELQCTWLLLSFDAKRLQKRPV